MNWYTIVGAKGSFPNLIWLVLSANVFSVVRLSTSIHDDIFIYWFSQVIETGGLYTKDPEIIFGSVFACVYDWKLTVTFILKSYVKIVTKILKLIRLVDYYSTKF